MVEIIYTIEDANYINSIYMSILKKVPIFNIKSPSFDDDPRHDFFTENLNSEKYYYMTVRNTLVPLGTFIQFQELPNNNNSIRYGLKFSIKTVFCGETLVYTDYPPAAASVPLTYTDYENIVGGKKTRKRKNKKLKKTQKNKKIKK
jgi:hypothetical protein